MTSEELEDIKFDPAQAVLSNPDILHSIFPHLSRKDWTSCRSVCKAWNLVATPLFAKNSYLSLNEFCAGLGKYDLIQSPPPVNPFLLRKVKVTCEPPPRGKNTGYDKLMDLHFFTAAGLYKDKLEELSITADVNFYRTLALVFGKHNFTKLRKLTVHEIWHWRGQALSTESYPPKLKRLVGMKALHFWAVDYKRKGRTEFGYLCYPTYQELINCSPNLERLKIDEHFYPDLSTCSKLTSLKWSGAPFDAPPARSNVLITRYDFNYAKLYEMLDCVKGSLEKLKLGTNSYNQNNQFPHGFQVVAFPRKCFPQLTSLTIDDLKIYSSFLGTLNEKNFPVLQSLKIIRVKKGWKSWMNDWLRDKVCLPTVESLSISKPSIARVRRIFPDITRVFPNLKTFSIALYELDDNPEQELNDVFYGIASAFVHLDKLIVQVHLHCHLSVLLKGLCRPSDSTALPSLTLVLDKSSSMKDRGCNEFEEAFLHYKNITLDGFLFRGSTVTKMNDFALRHNINLQFIN